MKNIIFLSLVLAPLSLLSPAARAAEAADNWAHNCAACHGKDGAGHTRAGKKIGVKDLTDAAYQKSFTDDQAFQDIKNGAKDKDGRTLMSPFAGKLSDDEIKALVSYVRTLQK
jgi:cytochrome c553